MASIEGSLVALLQADATLTALVGTRIYPLDRPLDAVKPYVVYQKSGASRDQGLNGLTNLRLALFSFDCYGTEEGGYSSCNAVAEALTDSLLGFSRGDLDSAQIRVQGIWIEDASDEVNPPPHGEELGEMYERAAFAVAWNQD